MDEEKNKALSQNAKPEPTWFFERTGDGFIFAAGEEEAWNLLNNPSRWARRDIKMIGHSNGETYFKMIKDSRNEATSLVEEKASLNTDLGKYLQTEDDLRFKQLKDDTDEMVIKVVEKRRALQDKLQEIDEKLANINKYIVEKAFNAELEIARQDMTRPSNRDIITPVEKDRGVILNNLGR